MPLNRETQRAFGRFVWRQRLLRTLKVAPPVAAGAGLVAGLFWLRSHGGTPWIGLGLAGTAALAKPALLVMRAVEKRRRRRDLGD